MNQCWAFSGQVVLNASLVVGYSLALVSRIHSFILLVAVVLGGQICASLHP